MFNMLNKLNNITNIKKVGGSLVVVLTDYLLDLDLSEGDPVIINSENQIRAFSEVKIITIEKYTGGKK